MPANKSGIKVRQIEVAEIKLADPKKTTREIGEEIGISKSAVSRDLISLGQDGTIEEHIKTLQENSLTNAVTGTEVEGKYLGQINGKENMTPQEAAVASQIAEKNQKRYSFLKGINSDNHGGDASPIDMSKDEIVIRLIEIRKLKTVKE